MSKTHKTLRQFLLEKKQGESIDPDLLFVVEDIATACCAISHHVHNGPFAGTLGVAGTMNIQGEDQKQLDVIANDEFLAHCRNHSRVAALVSEEVDEVYWLKDHPQPGDFIIYFDPLDGSSNLNVNLSVGSIFSIVVLPEKISAKDDASVLRKGAEQVCAGYTLYGPSTQMMLTIGDGVDGFTYQRNTGEFWLTTPEVTIPAESQEFAINASRRRFWDPAITRYVDECTDGPNGPRKTSFNMRWTASMVAEVHRILTRGGIFLYPVDSDNKKAGGKLRLLYEGNPMSLIVERAGGKSSDGYGRILDIQPEGHHQRVSVLLGSADEVDRLEAYYKEI